MKKWALLALVLFGCKKDGTESDGGGCDSRARAEHHLAKKLGVMEGEVVCQHVTGVDLEWCQVNGVDYTCESTDRRVTCLKGRPPGGAP